MVSNLKEIVKDLKQKFASSRYRNDPGLLKQRVKEQGTDIYHWLHTFEDLFVVASPETRDDILFYVKYDSKNKREIIEVQRRDAKSLPDHSDQSVLWDQTLYLNLLLHEFEYQLTCCVLNQKKGSAPISERMRTQITMQVYPSTKERRMDKKSRTSEDSYPNLLFYIDNYEQIFNQISLHCPGEKVAVQIVAVNPALSIKKLIFMGGLDFTVLRDAVMQKEKENASFRLLSRKKSYTEFQDDFFFIQMKGPDDKGHAQMAVQLTNSNNESYIKEPLTDNENPLPANIASNSSTPLESSTSSSDTVDINTGEPSTKTVTSNNYLVPQSDTHSTSPDGESITSSHSSDHLCPSKDKHECTATMNETSNKEQDGGYKKIKKSSKRRSSKKNSKEQPSHTVHAYLTYIQLPWYTITEDILQGSREPLF